MCKITLLFGLSWGMVLSAQATRNHDIPLTNWRAPLYWQPSPAESEAARGRLDPGIRPPAPEATTPVGSLVFVAMTPCRVVDTRTSSGFPAPFGMPNLTANTPRSFPIQSSTLCTIPSNAMAYSFNVTLVPPGPVGYLTIWPTAGPPNTPPNAVTLDDFPTGDLRNNAAIVPAGITNGSVSAITNAATDLVIDINGYYAPLTGVTLAQGTAAAPSLSFSGDAKTGMFSSGMGTLSLTTGGMAALTVDSNADVELAGSVRKGGTLFLHNLGGSNTAVGLGALRANMGTSNTATGSNALNGNTTGYYNTADGDSALAANTTGTNNTASGVNALLTNTTGSYNTANGAYALKGNTTGIGNTASGSAALISNTTGAENTAVGDEALHASLTGNSNVAIGSSALENNTSGNYNTGIGIDALFSNSTGGNNIGVGPGAGQSITTGSFNIDIGNDGTANDGTAPNSGVIRIGSGSQSSFFAAGIYGVMTGGSAVLINSSGQLGTVSSSRRYKENIQDMRDASSGLMRLRPVTFNYQKPYDDGSKPLDYGLIAEEVAEIYPDLVLKNPTGQVESVQYHKLTPMLLNELQKERRERAQEQQNQNETIQALQAQVSALQKAVETLLSAKGQPIGSVVR